MADEYRTSIPCVVQGPGGFLNTNLELTLQADSLEEALSVVQSWFAGCTKPISISLPGVYPPPEPEPGQ
jgi:hypothetical protein